MESRFDQQPWYSSDASRESRAGTKIGFRGVVNEYRADLPERCAAAKVKTQGGHYGCLHCTEQSKRLHDRVAEVTLRSVPWQLRTHNSFLDEVATHLVAVTLHGIPTRNALAASLAWCNEYPWGRRVQGTKGSAWGLAAGDQLIVSDDLHNPHDLEDLNPGSKVFFFRPRKESGLVGVSLLINTPGVHSLGIDGFQIGHFCECTLHTLDLGVAQRFCGTAIVKALKCNIYKLPLRSAKKLVQMGSHKIAKDIKQYYKDEHKANPWKKLSQLSRTFYWKHLGPIKYPCLKAKGGQTRCLVKFCTGLMQKYGHDCGTSGQYLAKAGQALLNAYDVMDIEPRRMCILATQRLMSAMVNHVVFYRAAGGHLVYKHHGCIHMALMAGWIGNPKCVSTYEDEHENGVVAKIALVAHGSTFAKSVFERIELHNPERKMQMILP